MSRGEWVRDPQTVNHVNELETTAIPDLVFAIDDPKGYAFECASVRFDGCVHFYTYDLAFEIGKRDPEEEHEYMHICDLDGLIEKLTKLKEAAKRHFGENWPD